MNTSSTRLRTALLVAALVSLPFASSAFADNVVPVTSDTEIVLDNGDANALTYHNTPLGPSTIDLLALKPTNQDFQYYPLLKFDLSSYSGDTVTGGATLSLYVNNANVSSFSVGLVSLAAPFNPATTTYDNYYGTEFSGGSWGAAIGSAQVFFPTSAGFYSFAIPQATVQSWIDSPSANYGIGIVTTYGTPGVVDFSSSTGGHPATLSFSAVPEPSTYAAIAGGLMLGIAMLRRRKSAA